jgi:hypothetical protein
VSVQPQEQQHDLSLDAPSLVGSTLSSPDDWSNDDLLPNNYGGSLDNFAFTDGALDASFNAPLNFSFDDLIDDAASFAVDAQASGAV